MTMQYKQHVFKTNGIFTLAYVPPNGSYFDALLVGGGGSGGSGPRLNDLIKSGGSGGEVVYKRVYVNLARNFLVTVGNSGAPSSIADLVTANGGTTGGSVSPPDGDTSYLDSTLGTLVTDGLFYDNTVYYGGTGVSLLPKTNAGVLVGNNTPNSSGGGIYTVNFILNSTQTVAWNGYDGAPNTGGGGGAACQTEYANYFGTYGISGKGGSGIVIIRYPIIN